MAPKRRHAIRIVVRPHHLRQLHRACAFLPHHARTPHRAAPRLCRVQQPHRRCVRAQRQTPHLKIVHCTHALPPSNRPRLYHHAHRPTRFLPARPGHRHAHRQHHATPRAPQIAGAVQRSHKRMSATQFYPARPRNAVKSFTAAWTNSAQTKTPS